MKATMQNFVDLSPLKTLLEDTKPEWGIMTPQHMVEHLCDAVKISNGKLVNLDCMNPDEKLPILKRFLNSSRPLPQNFVNTVVGSELKPLANHNLKEAISELEKEISEIDVFFELNSDAKPINPTFGPLNKEEWIQFHKKHFRHHMKQFGLIKE